MFPLPVAGLQPQRTRCHGTRRTLSGPWLPRRRGGGNAEFKLTGFRVKA
jgi:hypothetical protein